MKRIFPDHTYGPGPRNGCWWDETCTLRRFSPLSGAPNVDVAIIGAGVTGLNAALTLAKAGAQVTVVDAEHVGWGASGRNGGFCCLGGGMASDDALDRKFGRSARYEFRQTEKHAVELVSRSIQDFGLEVDRHSKGETQLAHNPREFERLRRDAHRADENYGIKVDVISRSELAAAGMNGPFHGALTNPLGFGMNPRKYLAGLVERAVAAGVQLHDQSPVLRLQKKRMQFCLETPAAWLNADQVIVATNGYTPEDLSRKLEGRFLPAQSTVLVTRPLTESELDAQGWRSPQMCYDTRNLLHYFRLMPDRRFLFGMRGGLLGGAAAERRARLRLFSHFKYLFPAWSKVETTNCWSGLVALARSLLPFAGAVPGSRGLYAALCYHGNGLAMGSFCGQLVGALAAGQRPALYPEAIRQPMLRYPMGAARRLLMPPVYGKLMLQDAF